MRRTHRSILSVALLLLSACESTDPDPFPSMIGRYTFDALFRDALASDVRARGTMNISHMDRDTGQLLGDADIQLTVTGQEPLRFTAFELATVARDGQIAFRLHLPDAIGDWRFTGTVSPSGSTIQGNHVLTVGEAVYGGTWTAGRM